MYTTVEKYPFVILNRLIMDAVHFRRHLDFQTSASQMLTVVEYKQEKKSTTQQLNALIETFATFSPTSTQKKTQNL